MRVDEVDFDVTRATIGIKGPGHAGHKNDGDRTIARSDDVHRKTERTFGSGKRPSE